jgi:hypothetical protein
MQSDHCYPPLASTCPYFPDFRLLHTLHLDTSNEFFKLYVAVYRNPIHLVLVCKKKIGIFVHIWTKLFFFTKIKKNIFSHKSIFLILGNFF